MTTKTKLFIPCFLSDKFPKGAALSPSCEFLFPKTTPVPLVLKGVLGICVGYVEGIEFQKTRQGHVMVAQVLLHDEYAQRVSNSVGFFHQALYATINGGWSARSNDPVTIHWISVKRLVLDADLRAKRVFMYTTDGFTLPRVSKIDYAGKLTREAWPSKVYQTNVIDDSRTPPMSSVFSLPRTNIKYTMRDKGIYDMVVQNCLNQIKDTMKDTVSEALDQIIPCASNQGSQGVINAPGVPARMGTNITDDDLFLRAYREAYGL